jgi:low molecular weight protein-tyrosine phosphatase
MTVADSSAWTGRAAVRDVYRLLRNFPDRLLHHRRHAAACKRVLAAHRPKAILVVCYGNVCRSPYLQAVLQRALPEMVVTSGGFVGSGRPVPEASARLSAERGLDLSVFRSGPLTNANVRGADIILVMDPRQARELLSRFPGTRERILLTGDLDPRFDLTRGIADPWNRPADVFEACFDRLDRCAKTLVDLLEAPSEQRARSA